MTKLFVIMTILFVTVKNYFDIGINRGISGRRFDGAAQFCF